jgi:RNA polymerase sigma-70 factor, ECF subfamily
MVSSYLTNARLGRDALLANELDAAPASSLFAEFELRVRSDYARLLRFAHKVTQNDQDAEDAVQDALLHAFQHLAELRSGDKLKSWMATIVFNCARLQYRDKNRLAVSLDRPVNNIEGIPLADLVEDSAPSPENQYSNAEHHQRLESLVRRLPQPLRETFLCRHIYGFNTRDTANRLGVSERCVRVRLSRAMTRLRRLAGAYATRLSDKTSGLRVAVTTGRRS